MKRIDLEQLLLNLGAELAEGSKHTKVYLNGKQTTLPRHREINDILVRAIKKQLDIKD